MVDTCKGHCTNVLQGSLSMLKLIEMKKRSKKINISLIVWRQLLINILASPCNIKTFLVLYVYV